MIWVKIMDMNEKKFYGFFMKIKNRVRVSSMRSMTTCQRITILNDDIRKIKILKKMTRRKKNSKKFFFDRNRAN